MIDEGIEIYFDTGSLGFAQTGSFYAVSGSTSLTIPVIYDSEYTINMVSGIGYQNDAPSVLCKSTDVVSGSTNSVLSYGGITYYVKEVQVEGTGTTRLLLTKVKVR